MELREYQRALSAQGVKILRRYNLLYLAMEVRTGKTLTALEVARLYGAKNVLFLTKLKAIEQVKQDYHQGGFTAYYGITVSNDESLHKVEGLFDLVIHDEHHRFGAFPKMSERAKAFALKWSRLPMIFLSGTPTPEGFSQIYHQFKVSVYSPFSGLTNFYRFAEKWVNVKDQYIRNNQTRKDYSDCNPEVMREVEHLMLTYTQQEAGFRSEIKERFITVPMAVNIEKYLRMLHRDLVVEGKEESIVADTGAKLKNKTHQLCSGTIIFESGKSQVLDDTKARVIRNRFIDNKILIFYKYKAEFEAIKQVFGEDVTDDVERWKKWALDGALALQIQAGREALTLPQAEYIVFYNIDYSALSYWQARDRMTTIDRKENTVYWVFTDGGIERKIYERVQEKKDYTLKHFKRDYGVNR